MKGTDRFLLAIVAGILVLVLAALVMVAIRPKPAYQPDDTPQGVVHNYLFAINQSDFARAYRYLAPSLPGYPTDVEAFTHDIEQNSYNFPDPDTVTLTVEETNINGQRATVTVNETVFYEGGLLGSSEYTNTIDFTLRLDEGAWHITGTNGYSYWVYCWDDREGCD